jgi:hypothetical protein
MKRIFFCAVWLAIFLGVSATAFGQKSCEFNIVGTWQVPSRDSSKVLLYRFAPDGTVTVLSSSTSKSDSSATPKEIAKATYELDDKLAPQSIKFTATSKSKVFPTRESAMDIVKYDDESLTCGRRGSTPVRWGRVDPNHYFIVLAARREEFYDRSGSAFPLLIKVSGNETQIEAVGTYSEQGKRAFGAVPPESYKDFLREARGDSEVMLRLEINSQQYQRALDLMHTSARRAREGALLYPNDFYLNNILLVKAVTETLNQCSEDFTLYKLNYIHPEDWISNEYAPGFVPFVYFKELRRLNDILHVRDNAFQQASHPGNTRGHH